MQDNLLIPQVYEDIGYSVKIFYGVHLESTVTPLVPILSVISIVLSMLFIVGIVYATFRFRGIRIEEREKSKPINIEDIEDKRHVGLWDVILKHMESDNPAEWKIAIIEADNLLDELLRERGYEGETIGEKMKSMDGKKMVSLQAAWDAHKIRNEIAHESEAELPRRKAVQAIVWYEQVFKDLGVF